MEGTVFEVTGPGAPGAQGSRVPSAGAFVIVHWTGYIPRFGHGESVCLQAAIAMTDAQGRFSISEPPPLRSTLMVLRNEPYISVYKPGYDTTSNPRARGAPREWLLVPTKLTREQRASLAEWMPDTGCRDDKGNLIPVTDPQGVLSAYQSARREESGAKPAPPMQLQILPRSGPLPAESTSGRN